MRQRPGTAKGVVFMTLEDETGIANIIVWPKVFEKNRRTVMTARFLAVRGRLQRAGLVIHVVAESFSICPRELPWLREGGELFSPKFSGRLPMEDHRCSRAATFISAVQSQNGSPSLHQQRPPTY